jgi:hypothetical protein
LHTASNQISTQFNSETENYKTSCSSNPEKQEMNRRDMLLGLGASALLSHSLTAVDKKDEKGKAVDYLFVQNSGKVLLKNGVLTLKKVNPATLYFSDRPDRIVGHVPTTKFVTDWGTGNDSFKANLPNAALSIVGDKEPQQFVVVLKSPRLEDGNLVYDVKVLDGDKSAKGGECSLFIDIIGRPLTPLSFAGVARRGVLYDGVFDSLGPASPISLRSKHQC